jgi:hypothetical protein
MESDGKFGSVGLELCRCRPVAAGRIRVWQEGDRGPQGCTCISASTASRCITSLISTSTKHHKFSTLNRNKTSTLPHRILNTSISSISISSHPTLRKNLTHSPQRTRSPSSNSSSIIKLSPNDRERTSPAHNALNSSRAQ